MDSSKKKFLKLAPQFRDFFEDNNKQTIKSNKQEKNSDISVGVVGKNNKKTNPQGKKIKGKSSSEKAESRISKDSLNEEMDDKIALKEDINILSLQNLSNIFNQPTKIQTGNNKVFNSDQNSNMQVEKDSSYNEKNKNTNLDVDIQKPKKSTPNISSLNFEEIYGIYFPVDFTRQDLSVLNGIGFVTDYRTKQMYIPLVNLRMKFKETQNLIRVIQELLLRGVNLKYKDSQNFVFSETSTELIIEVPAKINMKAYKNIEFSNFGISSIIDSFNIQSSHFFHFIPLHGFVNIGIKESELHKLIEQFLTNGFNIYDSSNKRYLTKQFIHQTATYGDNIEKNKLEKITYTESDIELLMDKIIKLKNKPLIKYMKIKSLFDESRPIQKYTVKAGIHTLDDLNKNNVKLLLDSFNSNDLSEVFTQTITRFSEQNILENKEKKYAELIIEVIQKFRENLDSIEIIDAYKNIEDTAKDMVRNSIENLKVKYVKDLTYSKALEFFLSTNGNLKLMELLMVFIQGELKKNNNKINENKKIKGNVVRLKENTIKYNNLNSKKIEFKTIRNNNIEGLDILVQKNIRNKNNGIKGFGKTVKSDVDTHTKKKIDLKELNRTLQFLSNVKKDPVLKNIEWQLLFAENKVIKKAGIKLGIILLNDVSKVKLKEMYEILDDKLVTYQLQSVLRDLSLKTGVKKYSPAYAQLINNLINQNKNNLNFIKVIDLYESAQISMKAVVNNNLAEINCEYLSDFDYKKLIQFINSRGIGDKTIFYLIDNIQKINDNKILKYHEPNFREDNIKLGLQDKGMYDPKVINKEAKYNKIEKIKDNQIEEVIHKLLNKTFDEILQSTYTEISQEYFESRDKYNNLFYEESLNKIIYKHLLENDLIVSKNKNNKPDFIILTSPYIQNSLGKKQAVKSRWICTVDNVDCLPQKFEDTSIYEVLKNLYLVFYRKDYEINQIDFKIDYIIHFDMDKYEKDLIEDYRLIHKIIISKQYDKLLKTKTSILKAYQIHKSEKSPKTKISVKLRKTFVSSIL